MNLVSSSDDTMKKAHRNTKQRAREQEVERHRGREGIFEKAALALELRMMMKAFISSADLAFS